MDNWKLEAEVKSRKSRKGVVFVAVVIELGRRDFRYIGRVSGAS